MRLFGAGFRPGLRWGRYVCVRHVRRIVGCLSGRRNVDGPHVGHLRVAIWSVRVSVRGATSERTQARGVIMLDITVPAAEAINILVSAAHEDDGAGLRIAVATKTEQGAGLEVSCAHRPAPDDEVITSEAGAQVFLEPEAARYLTDKVLDVRKDVDGRFHFAFHGKI